jgi:hypothetical protein
MRYPLEYQLHLFRPIYDVPEILTSVIDFIDYKNLIINVQLADKHFHALSSDKEIWKKACKEHEFDENTSLLYWYDENDKETTEDYKRIFLDLTAIDIKQRNRNKRDGVDISIEYSKSNRSKCRTCHKLIDKSVLRVVEEVEESEEDYYKTTRFHHYDCFGFPSWVTSLNNSDLKSKDVTRVDRTMKQLKHDRKMKYLADMPVSKMAYQCDVCKQYCNDVYHECRNCSDYHVCDKCRKTSIPSEHKKHKFRKHDVDLIYSCDICDKDVECVLYHCQICESYDICENCCHAVQSGTLVDPKHSSDHVFFKVGQRNDTPPATNNTAVKSKPNKIPKTANNKRKRDDNIQDAGRTNKKAKRDTQVKNLQLSK